MCIYVVPAELDSTLADCLRGFPEVVAAWLFGSWARGNPGPESDFDLALLLHEPPADAGQAADLLARVAVRLESIAPGGRVDLVLIDRQGPVFQHRVLAQGRLVYEADPRRRIDFESETYLRYFDFAPTHALAMRHALVGFRQWLDGSQ